MTVEALAKEAHMVKGTLLRYLQGQRDIPVPALVAIATALGVEPGKILDRAAERAKAEDE